MNAQQHNTKVDPAAGRNTCLGNIGVKVDCTVTNGNEISTDPIESLNNLEQQLHRQMTTFNFHLGLINECAVNIANLQQQLIVEIRKVRKVNEGKDTQIYQLNRRQNTNAGDIQSPSESTIQVNTDAAVNDKLEIQQNKHIEKIPLVPAGIVNVSEENINASSPVENAEDNQPGPLISYGYVAGSTRSTTELQYECHICKRTFKIKSDFEKHQQMRGIKPVELECTICYRTFCAESILDKHIRKHSVPTHHQCHLCNNYFGRASDLAFHIRAHTVRNKSYSCPICSKKFSSPTIFRNHQKKHLLASSSLVSCKHCYKTFRTEKGLASHSAKFHRSQIDEH